VNEQGRFHIVRGRLRAVNPHDAVAAAFHGRSVEEGITLMRERAEGQERHAQGRVDGGAKEDLRGMTASPRPCLPPSRASYTVLPA
jgi:hypothetical protein